VPTLVLYGDVPLTRAETLNALVGAAGGDHLGVLTVHLDDPTGYGRIVRDAAGRITRIVEQKDANETQLAIHEVNTGILVCPTAKLKTWLATLSNNNAQGEYYLTDVIERAANEGVPITSAHPLAEWETLGVNSKVQLAELERTHQRNLAQQLLEDGVTLIDPARIDIRGKLTCGRDVVIDVNCIFEGNVTLGDGVHVGANCVIRAAAIEAGAEILPFCHIEQAKVGAESRIGPYARLRPGTELAEDVHIGNFVEVKNSRLADGAKANHLAYLGDSTVGRRVNYGAGSITANYDGANKHRTVIEDDAHVGSNCVLVAPVTVGAGATIGAGSTIGKDAPAGQLTVARAKQVSLSGWSRPAKAAKKG
jgi:bifunctional UDP-N-acetylglucosamine pyrophosphorylase/glucosamine-1-phosphate N-acetyltransferase